MGQKDTMLEVKDLHASVGGNKILRGVNLSVPKGEVRYKGEDLLAMSPEERAREGVFLAFQYPVEISGVSNVYFLKAAANAIRKHRGEEELDALEFLSLVREKAR